MNNQELDLFRMNYKRIVNHRINSERKDDSVLEAFKTIKVEKEDSYNLLCYVGSFIRHKTLVGYYDTLTYEENYNYTYKKYIDIETETIYDVFKEKVPEFEKNHNIFFPKLNISNMQEYHKAYMKIRKEFLSTLIVEDQNKSMKKVLKDE